MSSSQILQVTVQGLDGYDDLVDKELSATDNPQFIIQLQVYCTLPSSRPVPEWGN